MKVHALLLGKAAKETFKTENSETYSSGWSHFDPVLASVSLSHLLLPLIIKIGGFW